MNPYRDFMQKQAFGYDDLRRDVIGFVAKRPALQTFARDAHAVVTHDMFKTLAKPVGRGLLGAVAIGVPVAAGMMAQAKEKHLLEATLSQIAPEFKKRTGITDDNMIRRVFMTIASASPAVASNPMLALNAMLNWYDTSGQGTLGFQVDSYAKLQGIQKDHRGNGGGLLGRVLGGGLGRH